MNKYISSHENLSVIKQSPFALGDPHSAAPQNLGSGFFFHFSVFTSKRCATNLNPKNVPI